MCSEALIPVETTLFSLSFAATLGLGFVLAAYPGRSSAYRTASAPQVASVVVGILAVGYLGPTAWRWSTQALGGWNADLPVGRVIGDSCGSVANGADWLFPALLANATVITLLALRRMPSSGTALSHLLKRTGALAIFAMLLSVQALTVPAAIRWFDPPGLHLRDPSEF